MAEQLSRDHNRFRVRISVACFCNQSFNQRRNLLRCSKDISGGPRDLPPQRVRPQITSAVSPIRECSRVILLQNKFNSLPIYLQTQSGVVLGYVSTQSPPSELQAHVKWDIECLSQGHIKKFFRWFSCHTNLHLGSILSYMVVS